MMPYPELGTITDEDRAAVTRMMSREPDGDVLLAMLIGETSAPSNQIQRTHTPVTASEREKVRWLRSRGMNVGDIAVEIGRSRQTVSLIVKEQEA